MKFTTRLLEYPISIEKSDLSLNMLDYYKKPKYIKVRNTNIIYKLYKN